MRSLIIGLTVVSITSAYDQQCTPGTYFKNDCNTCVCSYESRPVCTTKVCQSGFYNPSSSFQDPLDYVPQIIPGINHIEVIPAQQIGESHSAAYEVCTPNSFFYINCNRCWCSVFGDSYSCTQSTCAPTQPYQKVPDYPQYPQQNVPDYPQYPQQNVPGCPQCPHQNVPNQQPTHKVPDHHHKHSHGCGHYRKRLAKHANEKLEKICEASKKFKEYCNDCICSADGTDYTCTKKICNAKVYKKDGSFLNPHNCEPNTTFRQYCNLCVCPEVGFGETACTAKACKDDAWYEDGTLQNPKATMYKNGATCNAGQLFYSGCNQCICRDNGKSAYCTLKRC